MEGVKLGRVDLPAEGGFEVPSERDEVEKAAVAREVHEEVDVAVRLGGPAHMGPVQ